MVSIYTTFMPKSNYRTRKIYLDYASGALKTAANPGAIHSLGVAEKDKLNKARARIARLIGARPDEIIFTSGATEANNLAILGLPRGHVVTTNIEHASVMETAKHQAAVTYVPVQPNGIIDPKKVRNALRPNTVLVSVIYANNEIGTIQPIKEIAKEIRHYNKMYPYPTSPYRRGRIKGGIIFHTDAVQAANYLELNVEKLGVDLMTFNAAKIYGPHGIGVLYKKRNVRLSPLFYGGNQEFGLRPGTENVAATQNLARTLKQADKIKKQEVKRLTKLRDYFINKLEHSQIFKNTRMILNGDKERRLPNNVNITIPGIPGDLLVIELSAQGVMVGSKSACKEGEAGASQVIKAINPLAQDTDGSVRFSLGRETTKADIDRTLQTLFQILKKLKIWYN